MRFHADLHIHSKYSRATSKNADLENLAYWAAKKGIAVVGTGDFTHPAWRAELKDKLAPAEPGLFRLRDDLAREVAARLPAACPADARFMLSVEISTIYKKGERTRKVHHLVYVPDFEAAGRFVASLERIGNLASDGRPILGLDSRHLLEIALESSPDAYLVPAHVWTPWFAVLGSRSGFDSVLECYGDLADHIFAIETGLSSDPAMNWRISSLDRYRLVSNSDAHSPAKLGREATLFDCAPDYFALKAALATGRGYVGTVEFFPEEGKYHLDGHRKCNVRLSPEETRRHGGRCPVCGQPVTVGVMHRVETLADRGEGEAPPPATAGEVASLVPLPEIIAEIAGTGPASQAVARGYERVVGALGPELAVLETVPVEDVARADGALLGEAIRRLRTGQVIREAGYDGEYGVIRLFEPGELRRRTAGGLLFDLPDRKLVSEKPVEAPEVAVATATPVAEAPSKGGRAIGADGALRSGPLAGLDEAQRAAAAIVEGPLLIVAGPGSGKTRTLTHRIAHLVAEHGAAPEACLAVTFTRRAAAEMRARLAALLPERGARVSVHTFHSLGLAILREHGAAAGLHRGFRVAGTGERAALLADSLGVSEGRARTLLAAISKAKRTGAPDGAGTADALETYGRALALRNWVDFDDLVGLAARALEADPLLAAMWRERCRWISVDELQDLDAQQYRLLRLLAPPDANLCVIGDANQAIYGFRGADAGVFARFRADYPAAAVARLDRNYRSSRTIVAASGQVIGGADDGSGLAEAVRALEHEITVHAAPTERAEAEFVVHAIEELIGGHSFFSIDSGRAEDGREAGLSFADFAVLYRTDAQAVPLCEAFARSGIPFQKHSHAMLAELPGVGALLDALAAAEERGDGPASLEDRLAAAAARLAREAPAGEAPLIRAAEQRLAALARAAGGDAGQFAEAVLMASEADGWDARADRVSLLTLHAAKGLEFPVVFIAGLEDGVLPLRWGAAPDPAAEAEERRLLYVGMTRAMDRLLLSRAEMRVWRGGARRLAPSPFLRDIEEELIRHRERRRARRPATAQLELF